jgi:threonylcarbamoyladenosine tRNA methylthiotransferase MtaB
MTALSPWRAWLGQKHPSYIRYYTSVASFYVENFGCRATQADGAALERQFSERGLERAQAAAQAQIVVLNTCTVTAAADQDARAAIRRIHRQNPGCQIVVTGCYAQRSPQEIAALPGVSKVIGNSHKHALAEITLESGFPNYVPLHTLDNAQPRTFNVAFLKADSQRPTTNSVSGHAFRHAGRDLAKNAALAAEGASGFVPLHSLAKGQQPTTDDPIHVSDIFAHTELLAAPVFDAANERTRPNLKVQDGCDNRCSFCVIPYVRGQSRSLKLESVIREVRALVDAGYREVVISGINLGRWGRDLPVVGRRHSVVGTTTERLVSGHAFRRADDGLITEAALAADGTDFVSVRRLANDRPRTTNDYLLTTLIRSILDETTLEKLRISSVEPMDWSDELIALVAHSPRIAKHAHVPMQSGSDRILRAMHRKYRPWHYREKIGKIRAAMPTAAIGADVMVGFPGETDADFEETRHMVEELPFTYLHVFTYSARPGTPAASLPNQVPIKVARERNQILRDLASQKKLAFMKSFVGRTIQAITLNVFDGQYTEALTDNYLNLRIRGKHEPNQWLEAEIEVVGDGVLWSTA